MATVNFSVPDEVERAFNETFRGENKSAAIAVPESFELPADAP